MRHRKSFRKLSRTREHRRAVLRNLVTSLFLHERIETTVAKAKEARRVGERMITFAKRGDLSARRHVASYVHGNDVVKKLFETVAPWYAERNGGYTRIVRVGRRLGDAGETALLELVKSPELKEKLLLCHHPPGNPGKPITISVGSAAVPVHLAQHVGDHIGPCTPSDFESEKKSKKK